MTPPSIGTRATVLFHSGSLSATVLDERPATMPDLRPHDGPVRNGRDAAIDLRVEDHAAILLCSPFRSPRLPRPGQRPEPVRILVHPPAPAPPRRHPRCRKCHGGGTRRHHRACGWRAVGLVRKWRKPLPVREVRALLREVHPLDGPDIAARASFVVPRDLPPR